MVLAKASFGRSPVPIVGYESFIKKTWMFLKDIEVRFRDFEYTTSIKQPRFENLSKFLPIVLMKISNPDLDLAPKH